MHPQRLFPPTCLYLAIALILALHVLIPGPQLIASPWRYLGVLPVILGSAFNILADQALKRHNTTVKPFEASACLVTGGIFRFSRNPMYVGFVLLLGGIVVLLGSVTPWIVVVIFPFLMENRFIRAEEALLEAQFGNSWLEYRRQVRKWF